MGKLNSLVSKLALLECLFLVLTAGSSSAASNAPKPIGTLVDLGGRKLHVNCAGKASPTVVVETGLGDFWFDWILVQTKVTGFPRICTYDRAGYAWSNPRAKPRTFAQINLELHDALAKLGDHDHLCSSGARLWRSGCQKFCSYLSEGRCWHRVSRRCSFEGMRVGIGGTKTSASR